MFFKKISNLLEQDVILKKEKVIIKISQKYNNLFTPPGL